MPEGIIFYLQDKFAMTYKEANEMFVSHSSTSDDSVHINKTSVMKKNVSVTIEDEEDEDEIPDID